MALPAVVESLDAVPENAREFYRQDADGKRFILDAEDAANGEDLGALKRALEREKAERRKYARLAEERGGVDPEEYKALKAEKEAREREEAEKKGHFEKLLAQKDALYAKEREALELERRAALLAVEEYVVDAQATAAIAQHNGVPKLLLPLVKAQLKAIKGDDGKYRVAVLDSDGEERRNLKTNAPMTISELVAEMKADPEFGGAFKASGATGGGATGAATNARGGDLSKLSPLQKVERAFSSSGAN